MSTGNEYLIFVGKHRVGRIMAKNNELALAEARKLFPSLDTRVVFQRMKYRSVVSNVFARNPFQA